MTAQEILIISFSGFRKIFLNFFHRIKLKILSRARIPSFPNRFIWLNVNAPLTHFWSIFPFYTLEKPNTPQTLKKGVKYVQNAQWKHPNDVWCFCCQLWTYFTPFLVFLGYWVFQGYKMRNLTKNELKMHIVHTKNSCVCSYLSVTLSFLLKCNLLRVTIQNLWTIYSCNSWWFSSQ